MRAICPTCDTGYTVPDERIGAKGRKVRCTRCGEEWRVFLAAEIEAAAPPPPPPPRAAPPVEPPPAAPDLDDPFAAAGTDERDPFEVAADRRFEEAAAEPPARPAAGPLPTVVETGEPSPPIPALPLGRRVHIRTRRRMPDIGKETVARLVARVAPAVGPVVFLAACLTLGGVYVFRQAIVAAAPDLAGLYAALGAPVNLRGLVFGRIETLREIDNGQPVLVVEGSIANVSKQLREVPALRFALRGADTQELYAWSIDPKSTSIDSGDTIRFRTRLAAPPDLATEVQVRFVERRSQHAGLP